MKIQEHSACIKTKSPELESFSTVHCFRNWKIIYLHFPASVYAGYLFESWGPSIEQWQRCPSSIKSASLRGRRWKGKGARERPNSPFPFPFQQRPRRLQKREPGGVEQTTEIETVYSNKHDNFLQLSSTLFNIHKEAPCVQSFSCILFYLVLIIVVNY